MPGLKILKLDTRLCGDVRQILVQLVAQASDCLVDKRALCAAVHALADDLTRRSDGEVGGLPAHFRKSLRFGAGDLLFRRFHAPRHLLVDLVARFFGEEIVLVPKSALEGDPAQMRYFRLALDGPSRVESVRGTAVLERFRQYRDLFDYEYARLPQPLRELRRSVLSRSEVYLFGALIPAREWAVVVQRRREALDACQRSAEEARRFVLRYRARPKGGFDLVVEDIVFADGSRFRPTPSRPKSS